MAAGPAREPLLRWLRLLVDASAVTGGEARLASELADVLGSDHDVQRVGDSLVVGRPSGARPCVALVGHLDVVPPTDEDRTLQVTTREGRDVARRVGAPCCDNQMSIIRGEARRGPRGHVAVGRELNVPRVAVGPDADGRRAAQGDGEGCRRFQEVQQGVGARAGQRRL